MKIFINLCNLHIDKYFVYLYNTHIKKKIMVKNMSKKNKNRKQWSVSLDDKLEFKINQYKQTHDIQDNKSFLKHLFDNVLNLKPDTISSIDKICIEYNKNKNDLLTGEIERYVNKTLKKDGIIKEKNKHTIKAETELLDVLNDIVNENKKLPIDQRKYLSPTFVYKYLMMNTAKYKQKNYSVIKRVLNGFSSIDISFITNYHKENNLSVKSNLKPRSN